MMTGDENECNFSDFSVISILVVCSSVTMHRTI